MAAEIAAIALLVLLVFVTALGVLDRFILGMGLVWTEELSRYLLVWASFLAAIVATRRSSHFKVDFMSGVMGLVYARAMMALSIVICLVAAWYGVQFAWFFRAQHSPALGVSMAWVYASGPVGFLGIAYYLVGDFLRGGPRVPETGDGGGGAA